MLSDTVVTSIATGSSAVIIGVTALILNYRLFNSLERRIERIESDLKDFYKTLSGQDTRITVLEKRSEH
jgi:hypothetical protein